MTYSEAGAHNRSFSFSAWEGKQQTNKQPSNLYYNYKQRHDEVRHTPQGDMPTFGDGLDQRSFNYYNRNDYT